MQTTKIQHDDQTNDIEPLSYTITVNPEVYNDEFIDNLVYNFRRFCSNNFEQIDDDSTKYIRENVITVHTDK